MRARSCSTAATSPKSPCTPARASNVDYDLSTDTVVFTGNAFIDQPGRGNISGGRISYNTKSGQVQGSGEGQGPVKMQFQPKNGAAGSR